MVYARSSKEKSMAFDFTGKLVLVTGGNSGIGAEISKGVVAGGGHVVVCSFDKEEVGQKFVQELFDDIYLLNSTGLHRYTIESE